MPQEKIFPDMLNAQGKCHFFLNCALINQLKSFFICRIKVDEVYKPVVKKVVLMVIDAMRWDFVTGINSSDRMPFTTSLLQSNAGCIYKTRVKPPTVTMPRIKV